jgi:hypothetical protein
MHRYRAILLTGDPPDQHGSRKSMSAQSYTNMQKAIPQLYKICKESLSHLPPLQVYVLKDAGSCLDA